MKYIVGLKICCQSTEFVEPVLEVLRKSEFCMFAEEKDWVNFMALLWKKIIELKDVTGKRNLELVTHKFDMNLFQTTFKERGGDPIASFFYQQVNKVLQYDEVAKDFFDISERLDDDLGAPVIIDNHVPEVYTVVKNRREFMERLNKIYGDVKL